MDGTQRKIRMMIPPLVQQKRLWTLIDVINTYNLRLFGQCSIQFCSPKYVELVKNALMHYFFHLAVS